MCVRVYIHKSLFEYVQYICDTIVLSPWAIRPHQISVQLQHLASSQIQIFLFCCGRPPSSQLSLSPSLRGAWSPATRSGTRVRCLTVDGGANAGPYCAMARGACARISNAPADWAKFASQPRFFLVRVALRHGQVLIVMCINRWERTRRDCVRGEWAG